MAANLVTTCPALLVLMGARATHQRSHQLTTVVVGLAANTTPTSSNSSSRSSSTIRRHNTITPACMLPSI